MTLDKRTVLIVDDEEMLRSLICDIMESEGYEVLSAGNGREALEIFEKRGGEVGVVILDMSMPEMDGPQTFRALREIDPAIKVLVSSGYSDDPSVSRMIAEGARGIISKPFRVDDLANTVKKVIGE